MELKELVEKIIEQSGRVNAGNKEEVVGTVWADIEDWPAWYYEMFEWEENYDFSGKSPTSLQKLNISTLKNAVKSTVEEYVSELKSKKGLVVDVDAASLAIAERVTYWEDWYWDLVERVGASVESEEEQADLAAYASAYGKGIE